MCLAIPGQIVSFHATDGLQMGHVDFGGIVKEICLEYIEEPTIGEYVIVHAGFAISKLNEAAAMESLRAFRELGELSESAEGEP